MVQSGTCFIPLFALFWALSSIPFETPHTLPAQRAHPRARISSEHGGNKKMAQKRTKLRLNFLKGMLFAKSRFKEDTRPKCGFSFSESIYGNSPQCAHLVVTYHLSSPSTNFVCAALQSAKFIHTEHLWGDFCLVTQHLKSWFFVAELISKKRLIRLIQVSNVILVFKTWFQFGQTVH